MRDCTNTALLWNADKGDVALAPWPMSEIDKAKFKGYRSSMACYLEFSQADFEKRKTMLLIEFAHLVVRDGINASRLHKVLLEVAEWRDCCANDMPGAFEARSKRGED